MYGTYQFFLIAPLVGAFVIGLLFRGKLKTVRYFCWAVSIYFLLMLITSSYHHLQHNREESRRILGNYTLDIEKSKFHTGNLSKFKDLLLTVKSNNTFVFNKKAPFFPSTSGKWNFEDDGDVAYTECSFENPGRTFQIRDGFDTWTFESYHLKDGISDDLIVFAKTGK